ncbi:hypothetical protein ACNA06_04660 [Lysinibacillus sp. RSDA_15]|uniref:hypothetical protein n=1 Tax=Lysinibacillus TaxID=400634 RepID=UPI0018CF705E|nr:hypothetical protein [Lysinibacillus sphaericus]QTB14218.1 hypothetical protein J2B92_02950 [Lysinibacillus sphaericus]
MEEVVKESLEMYVEYVRNLPRACLHISNLIKEEGLISAINLIRQFSEGMSWVIDMNTLLSTHNAVKPLDIVEIQGFLTEITEAFEAQDYVLMSDLFEYELSPYFENHLHENSLN